MPPKRQSVKLVFLIDLAPCAEASVEDWYLKKVILCICKILSLAKHPSLFASESAADTHFPAQIYWGYQVIHSGLQSFQEKKDFRECSNDAVRIFQAELLEILTRLFSVGGKKPSSSFSKDKMEYFFSSIKSACLDFNWKSIIIVEHEPFDLLSPIRKTRNPTSTNLLYLFSSSNIHVDDPKEKQELLNSIQAQYLEDILSQKRIGLTWCYEVDCWKLLKDDDVTTNKYGQSFLSEVVTLLGGSSIALDEALMLPPRTPFHQKSVARKSTYLSLHILSKCIYVQAFPMGFVDTLMGSIHRRNYTFLSDNTWNLNFSGFYRKNTACLALRKKGTVPWLIIPSEKSFHFLSWLDETANRTLVALFYHSNGSSSSPDSIIETYVMEPLMSCMAVLFQVENSAMNVLYNEKVSLDTENLSIPSLDVYPTSMVAKSYEQLFHIYSSLFHAESSKEHFDWYCFGEEAESSSNQWQQQSLCYEKLIQEQMTELETVLKDKENPCAAESFYPEDASKESTCVLSESNNSMPSFIDICQGLLTGTKTREEIQKISCSALESLTNVQAEKRQQLCLGIQDQLLYFWNSERNNNKTNANEKDDRTEQRLDTNSTRDVAAEWVIPWLQVIAHIAIAMLECQDPSSKKNTRNIERSIIAFQEVSDDCNQLSEARNMLQFVILKYVRISLPQTASYLLTSFDLDESDQPEKTPPRRKVTTEDSFEKGEFSVPPEVLGTAPQVQGKGVLSGEVSPRTKAFLSGDSKFGYDREPNVPNLKTKLTQEHKQRNKRVSSIRHMKTIPYRESIKHTKHSASE